MHTDVLKMAGGLAAGYRKKHIDTGEGEGGKDSDESGEDGEVVRTKKKTRKVNKTCK